MAMVDKMFMNQVLISGLSTAISSIPKRDSIFEEIVNSVATKYVLSARHAIMAGEGDVPNVIGIQS